MLTLVRSLAFTFALSTTATLARGGGGCTAWDPRFAGPTLATSSYQAGAAQAFAVFDDGQGPGLYVAGDIETAGGLQSFSVARWSSSGWQGLSPSLNAPAYSLCVWDVSQD